jgi:hypothetical protein
VKLLEDFLKTKGEHRKPELIPPADLDRFLTLFTMAIQKGNGSEYEPDTLQSKLNSIRRYLMDKGYKEDINRSQEFRQTRDVLSSKRKLLKKGGLGNKRLKAEPVNADEIAKLRKEGLLGIGMLLLIIPIHNYKPKQENQLFRCQLFFLLLCAIQYTAYITMQWQCIGVAGESPGPNK